MTAARKARKARKPGVAYAPAVAGALGLALLLTGCSSGASGPSGGKPKLKVSGAYLPQPVMDDMAGGFLTVRNSGGAADRLTSVTSDISRHVEMHRTVHQKMERVRSLPVPAGGELKLSRGGNHLMLLDLKHKPAKGDKVSLTLRFEKTGPLTVPVPVKATNYVPE